jgi:hypothetical protein
LDGIGFLGLRKLEENVERGGTWMVADARSAFYNNSSIAGKKHELEPHLIFCLLASCPHSTTKVWHLRLGLGLGDDLGWLTPRHRPQ